MSGEARTKDIQDPLSAARDIPDPDPPGSTDSTEESQQPQESLDPQEQAENEEQEQDAQRPPSIHNNPPQQLHQRQGQEPVPYVHTAEG